jgi:resuscitation-promoting factor RpfB
VQFFEVKNIFTKSILKRASALAVMIIVTVSSVYTVAAATCNANINYNGVKKSVQLLSSSTDDILNAAGLKAGTDDLIIRSQAQTTGGDVNITVRSAYQVKVTADDTVKTVIMHYGDTVADAIRVAGIAASSNDSVVPASDTPVVGGMNIAVGRKFNITVTVDGKTKTAVVSQGSVEKALGQAGVTLDGDDIIVSAQKTAPVSEGMKLTVARVTYQEITTTQSIAYTNTDVSDKTIRKGTKKIQTVGKNGSKEIVVRQKLIDGKSAGSEIIKTTVLQQPVTQVTRIGSKKIASAYASISSDGTVTDQSGNTLSYKKCITGRCSAYSGGGRTSTGRAAAFGLVAVNPSIIPYGSRLYICSTDGKTVYGYAIAADTGGGVMTGRIVADLYYSNSSQCRNFGVKNMRIYVLS